MKRSHFVRALMLSVMLSLVMGCGESSGDDSNGQQDASNQTDTGPAETGDFGADALTTACGNVTCEPQQLCVMYSDGVCDTAATKPCEVNCSSGEKSGCIVFTSRTCVTLASNCVENPSCDCIRDAGECTKHSCNNPRKGRSHCFSL